jgi:nucleoside-diphosphate kinase
MMSTQDIRFSFLVDWYDAQASLIRQYQFLFYPKDNSIEMYDNKYRKKFFSRSRVDSVSVNQLFLGNKINVCSRQLEIVDFGDDYTRKSLAASQEKTLAIIKPDAVLNSGKIMSIMEQKIGLRISDARMVKLSNAQAASFYSEHQNKDFFDSLVEHMSSGPILAMALVGADAVGSWRRLLGPTNPLEGKTSDPNSIRAQFGSCMPKNAAHGSDSGASAYKELNFFFGPNNRLTTTASMGSDPNATCVVVKPHCVLAGQFGKVLANIQDSGWKVSAVQLHNFERANAEEFYEVYKEVVPEYEMMVSELCTGPCIALEVSNSSGTSNSPPSNNIEDQCVTKFKHDVAGYRDPVVAKELQSSSIRALFGNDKVRNAIHCTDLPDDTKLELSYMFQILCE